ncbi:alpha/beta hydrolase fold family protein [Mycobacterium xenopi 3993]|nr:alpha/beta hydrolase fold family protein [Mycobacterium xenopi 3993]
MRDPGMGLPDRRPGRRLPGRRVRPPRPRAQRRARRGGYSLNHLASDLDAVLEATLGPGERAVLAGHSMGGIAIAAWSDRYRHKVAHRADAVALINTTTGDLVRKVNLMPVPRQFAAARVLAARRLIAAFGGIPAPTVMRAPIRAFIAMMAVGTDADPRSRR